MTANGPACCQDTPSVQDRQALAVRIYPGWLAILVLSFGLYAATASRGAQWQDSGFHILRIVTGKWHNPLGLALSHPLHHTLGRLAIAPGWPEPCLAITLMSGLAAGFAAANLYGCVVALTGRRAAAGFAAASLALAHTFWQMATVAETYTLCAALLAGECWCLAVFSRRPRRGPLCGMMLLNGLGIANHMLASLTAPVLAAVALHARLRRRISGPDLLAAAALWLAGTLPYSTMVIAQMASTSDVAGTIRSALFGERYAVNVLNTSLSGRVLLVSLAFPLLNFPNLLLPAAVYGILRGGRSGPPRTACRALLAALAIHVVFALRYNVADQHTFFLPLYVLLTVFGGLGAAAVLDRPHRPQHRGAVIAAVSLLAATPILYALAPGVARSFRALDRIRPGPHKPYRDNYEYLLLPWSVADRSAEQMSRHALELAGPPGLILSEDPMANFALEYRQRQAGRDPAAIIPCPAPDRHAQLMVPPETIRRAAARGIPVVLVPLDADKPRTEPPAGQWRRQGDLYVLDAPKK